MMSSSRVSPCLNEMCCCFPLALLLYFWLLRYYFKTTYFCLQKCIKSEIYLVRFAHIKLEIKTTVFFKQFKESISHETLGRKEYTVDASPAQPRGTASIFFSRPKAHDLLLLLLSSPRGANFFLQINTAASILDCSNIYRRIILPQMC